MPNKSDVAVTKTVAVFQSATGAGKKIIIKATVKNAAGAIITDKKVGEITLSTDGTRCELDFKCSQAIDIFNGSNRNNDSPSLFGNHDVDTNLGDNYVKLQFEYDDGITFGIDFIGIYDK